MKTKMILKAIKYCQNKGEKNEWSISSLENGGFLMVNYEWFRG